MYKKQLRNHVTTTQTLYMSLFYKRIFATNYEPTINKYQKRTDLTSQCSVNRRLRDLSVPIRTMTSPAIAKRRSNEIRSSNESFAIDREQLQRNA